MTQDEAKKKITALVEKYDKLTPAGIKKYSEEDTKRGFIEPLFEALGWDTQDRNEVAYEENISGKRVDYSFYLNGRVKFYLEAKALKEDLNIEKFADQAIRYAWNKDVTWAVLTDFEGVKVFCAQNIERYLGDKQYFDIPYDKFLERFDQLWLLSKESFEKDKIDEEATKVGKKLQKVSVTNLLYKDLNKARELLMEGLSQCNPDVPEDMLDEGIQKLLDRIIFLRVAEDKQLEPSTLRPLIRQYHKETGVDLYESMIGKFRELDKIYNSDLFTPHSFEQWEEFSGKTEKAIELFYGKKGYYDYDFSVIPADVLGTVYENYLGYQLAKSQKGTALSKEAKKRKEQGIYYTPAYIVDYIVTSALKPILDKCKTVDDLKSIKVLDPACGSGSFLLKALEVIGEKYKEFGYKDEALTKATMILKENIYGVDLDDKAVEIAKLNLLVNSLDSKNKLPNLASNIKNGNSLISGIEEELKKYFGKDYRDKKPFNWEEEFPEVFSRKNPGFDLVIGNPPWISNDNIDRNEKDFYKNKYEIAESRFDIATLFTDRSTLNLRKGGLISFVMPEHVWIGSYFKPYRSYLMNNFTIKEILSGKEGHFNQVSNPASVFIATKGLKNSDRNIEIGVVNEYGDVNKKTMDIDITSRVIFDHFAYHLQRKPNIFKAKKLSDIALVTDGIQTANLLNTIFTQKTTNQDTYLKALRSGKDIRHRYSKLSWDGWWVLKPGMTHKYKRPGFSYDSPKRMACFNSKAKIILRQTEPTILATYDSDGYYFPNSIFQIALEKPDEEKLLWILGILNSKFMRFFYSKLAQVEGTTKPQIYLNIVKSLPLPETTDKNVAVLVKTMLSLNIKLEKATKNSNKWYSVKSEIETTDKKIDQLVYKLYDLTQDEISIIESTE